MHRVDYFKRQNKSYQILCICKKMFLDYSYGVDLIYTKAEIEKAKQSSSFPRENELQYLGLIGNVFS
jgi:hypothetical protein